MSTIEVTYWDADDEEVVLELPARLEVCGYCEGHGTVLREGMRGHAYSAEEFAEAFDDEEDRAAYFHHGGKYDVACPVCHGRNVVPVVDEDRIPASLKAQYAAVLEFDEERAASEAEDRQTERMERRMGC